MDIFSAYSLLLTASAPLKDKNIFITFHISTMFITICATYYISGGPTDRKNLLGTLVKKPLNSETA